MKPLIIRDEIHGDLTFDSVIRQAIDHEVFQRLRYIKQLGLAEYVFPCANHTRFQHSLGAAHLAGQYFESMVTSWVNDPFEFDGTSGNTRFFAERTRKTVLSVNTDPRSREFWKRVVVLGGLLHDVGHGPWSHTFEHLELKQNFDASTADIPGTAGAYFRALRENGERLKHEDLSVLYILRLLKDLNTTGEISSWEVYFAAIASLVNRRLSAQPEFGAELIKLLASARITGGIDFHRLLRPIVSGPFDVDRMDYIQRDGRNCGVHIAGIESGRIVNKLIPCLADHHGADGEPVDVVLVSNLKNQHIIDDFSFTLFQMYAQVYLHPKIVGLEEIIRTVLEKKMRHSAEHLVVDLEMHKSLSDERFRDLLKREFGITDIDKILFRQPQTHFEVARYPSDETTETALRASGFTLVEDQDRPMMKDSVGVFLFSSFTDRETTHFLVRPWSDVSPVASRFYSINYSPNIWIRMPNL